MKPRQAFYHLAGLGFLALAQAKHRLRGYVSPKPFDLSESGRCIDYDLRVVDAWLERLREYAPAEAALEGKNVLELGPGSDLGVGLYLLSKGCARYSACDVNGLANKVPAEFYEQLLARLEAGGARVDPGFLRAQLAALRAGRPERLRYVVSDRFDLVSACGAGTVDLVFSQAAMEHFDDLDATVSQLSQVCRPGALLVAEIDLKTHSRWIRDRDPNNIYRYSPRTYAAFGFRGIPSRLRPCHYREAFERGGWTEVAVAPLVKLASHAAGAQGMHPAFADPRNEMDYLSIAFCARRGPARG